MAEEEAEAEEATDVKAHHTAKETPDQILDLLNHIEVVATETKVEKAQSATTAKDMVTSPKTVRILVKREMTDDMIEEMTEEEIEEMIEGLLNATTAKGTGICRRTVMSRRS